MSLDAVEMIRTLPVLPSPSQGNMTTLPGTGLSVVVTSFTEDKESCECPATLVVCGAAGETHFASAAPRILKYDLYYQEEGEYREVKIRR